MNNSFETLPSRIELVCFLAANAKSLYKKICNPGYKLEFVVIYADSGVTIKKVASLSFERDLVDVGRLKEIRAFNNDAELHLVYDRASNSFIGRVRVDGNVDIVVQNENLVEARVLDEEHVLWGHIDSNKLPDADELILEEDRGTRIVMPRIAKNMNGGNLITIQVRNYLVDQRANELSFAFDDYRFVKFLVREGKKNGCKESER